MARLKLAQAHVPAGGRRPARYLVGADPDPAQDASQGIALPYDLLHVAKLGRDRCRFERLGFLGPYRRGRDGSCRDLPLQLLEHDAVVDPKAARRVSRLDRDQSQRDEGERDEEKAAPER
jgi:hypothetical protein